MAKTIKEKFAQKTKELDEIDGCLKEIDKKALKFEGRYEEMLNRVKAFNKRTLSPINTKVK